MTISANIKKVRSWNKILQKLCCRIEVSFIDKFFLIGKASLYKITGIFKFKSYCAIIVFHSPRKSLQRYSGSKAFIQSFPVVLVRTIIIKSQCCLGWITQKIELSNFEFLEKSNQRIMPQVKRVSGDLYYCSKSSILWMISLCWIVFRNFQFKATTFIKFSFIFPFGDLYNFH